MKESQREDGGGEGRGSPAAGERRPFGYYYDDGTGYEVYRPGEEDDDGEGGDEGEAGNERDARPGEDDDRRAAREVGRTPSDGECG